MDSSMQVFLSTLSQISVTAIVLLITGITAFHIYQLQRKITYEDEIVKERVHIKSYIFAIRDKFNTAVAFVPINFKVHYIKQFENTSKAEIWCQALWDINFDEGEDKRIDSKFIKAFESFNSEFHKKDYWANPLRFFIISEFLHILSKTERWKASNPKEIFPITASDLGYKEWEEDFKKIYAQKYEIEKLISGDENSMLYLGMQSFFLSEGYLQVRAANFSLHALNHTKDILNMLERINEHIKNIQEKEYISTHYYSKNNNVMWFICLLILISFLCGVIIPMVLINLGFYISPTIGNILFSITSILIICSIFLSSQIATPISNQNYTSHLRYVPLSTILHEHSKAIPEYGILDLSFLYDFINANKDENIPIDQKKEVKKYLELAIEYNSIVEFFASKVKIKLENEFQSFEKSSNNTGYLILKNSNWFNVAERNKMFHRAFENEMTIGFEIRGAYWSKVLGRLSFSVYKGSLESFISEFDKVASDISFSLEEKDFFNVQIKLNELNVILNEKVSTKWR